MNRISSFNPATPPTAIASDPLPTSPPKSLPGVSGQASRIENWLQRNNAQQGGGELLIGNPENPTKVAFHIQKTPGSNDFVITFKSQLAGKDRLAVVTGNQEALTIARDRTIGFSDNTVLTMVSALAQKLSTPTAVEIDQIRTVGQLYEKTRNANIGTIVSNGESFTVQYDRVRGQGAGRVTIASTSHPDKMARFENLGHHGDNVVVHAMTDVQAKALLKLAADLAKNKLTEPTATVKPGF